MWFLAAFVAVGLGVALARWFERRVQAHGHSFSDSPRVSVPRGGRDFNQFLTQIRRKTSRIR